MQSLGSEQRTRRWAWLPWAIGTAAAVIAAAALTAAFVASRYEARLGVIARQTAAVRESLEAMARDSAPEYRRIAELLRDPATRIIAMRGAQPSPQAAGRVIWHQREGGQLFVAKLPPVPPGRVYELWMVVAGKRRPAGLFHVGAAGEAIQRVPPADGTIIDGFEVTLEREGGVSVPTGRVVLSSQM